MKRTIKSAMEAAAEACDGLPTKTLKLEDVGSGVDGPKIEELPDSPASSWDSTWTPSEAYFLKIVLESMVRF